MSSKGPGVTPVVGYLKRSQLFGGLRDEDLRVFLPCCSHATFEVGSVIFRQGEPAKYLYIVGEGRVALEVIIARPEAGTFSPSPVTVVGPGGTVGWSALVEPHVFTLSASVAERCELVVVDGEAMRDTLRRHREVGYLVMANVAKLLALRLYQTREVLMGERRWTGLL